MPGCQHSTRRALTGKAALVNAACLPSSLCLFRFVRLRLVRLIIFSFQLFCFGSSHFVPLHCLPVRFAFIPFTFHYLSLPFITFHYLSLPFITFHYLSLPFAFACPARRPARSARQTLSNPPVPSLAARLSRRRQVHSGRPRAMRLGVSRHSTACLERHQWLHAWPAASGHQLPTSWQQTSSGRTDTNTDCDFRATPTWTPGTTLSLPPSTHSSKCMHACMPTHSPLTHALFT